MPQSDGIGHDQGPGTAAAVSLHVPGTSVDPNGAHRSDWWVAEETPVAILLNGEHFAVMMATPADLEDFAHGFALTEGIVSGPDDIRKLSIAKASDGYMVNLTLAPTLIGSTSGRKRQITGRSGCGICGAQSLAAAVIRPRPVYGVLPTSVAIRQAFDQVSDHQVMRHKNHSTHAAALCGKDGRILLLREDIGRHNALDKLAGAIARGEFDVANNFILISSRISYEMVQKSAAIGAPLLAAASAPSALSLRMAKSANLTLVVKAGDSLMYFTPNDFSESSS